MSLADTYRPATLYRVTVYPECACFACSDPTAAWWHCNAIALGTRKPVARYESHAECRVEYDVAIADALARHPGCIVVAA